MIRTTPNSSYSFSLLLRYHHCYCYFTSAATVHALAPATTATIDWPAGPQKIDDDDDEDEDVTWLWQLMLGSVMRMCESNSVVQLPMLRNQKTWSTG